jgi:hypothetical protein
VRGHGSHPSKQMQYAGPSFSRLPPWPVPKAWVVTYRMTLLSHCMKLYVCLCAPSSIPGAGCLSDMWCVCPPGLAYRLPVTMDAPVSPPEGRPMPVIIFSHG